jgi:hypothetical protein
MLTWISLLVYVVLSVASIKYNEPFVGVLAALGATIGVALAGSCLRWPAALERLARRAVCLVPWCLATLVLFLFWRQSCIQATFKQVPLTPIRIGTVALWVVFAAYARKGRGRPTWRFPAVAVLALWFGAWVILGWPRPNIDVWPLQQAAAAQLPLGINPYAAAHPEIPWNPKYDGEPVRLGKGLRSFPYPPLSLILVLPGRFLGDVRWALLAATVGAAAFLVATGRRLGLPAGHPWEMAAAAALFHPQVLLVWHYAWTEPLLALVSCICLWAMVAGRGRVAGLALAAVVTLKQYGFLWAIPIGCSRRIAWRHILLGGVAATFVIAPFLVWNPAAFWLGNFTYQLTSRSRTDSLSIPAVLADRTGVQIPLSFGFLLAAGVSAGVARWGGRDLSRTLLGSSAVLLSFFLFGKAGHLNYYWYTSSLVLGALVLSLAEPAGETGPDTLLRAHSGIHTSAGRPVASPL